MALQPQKRRACCATPLTSASAQFAVKWEKFPTVVGDEQMPTTTTATVPFFAVCLSVSSSVVSGGQCDGMVTPAPQFRVHSISLFRNDLPTQSHVTTIAFVSSSLSSNQRRRGRRCHGVLQCNGSAMKPRRSAKGFALQSKCFCLAAIYERGDVTV